MIDPAGRKRVGIALGGGVARGLTHIGVLATLEEEDIPIDCVAGTSMGALVGAAYCAGLEVAQLLDIAAETGWLKIVTPAWPHQGLISFRKMESWLKDQLGEVDIRDLAIPFAAMATDIETGKAVMLSEGPLARAVRASCSVPGLVEPVAMNGLLLCDGGVSDNVPNDAARALGADFVIGVDVFAPAYRSYLGPFGVTLAALEVLVENAGGGSQRADCTIVPDLVGQSYVRLSKYAAFIEAGRQATRDMLPTIRAALAEPSKSL
ncbi:MAG: patatin-like phospholipase family protein [Candidatus Promineifilaceae bacterium]